MPRPQPMSKMTTHTKLTRAVADDICRRIRGHVTRVPAAEANSIDRRTLWHWLAEGVAAANCDVAGCSERHHGPANHDLTYQQFAEMVMRAEADAAFLAAGNVSRAMSKDWRAAAWWLERRLPEDFAERSRVELSGPGGRPIEIDERSDLIERIERIAARVVEVEPLKKLP